jgi:very-short-patch-repair endonuclease
MRRELHIAGLAGRRHRIVELAQLEALGVSSGTVSRWVARGRLRRRHRGVYVYGSGELSREGEFLAAVLAIGDDAVLSDFAAAALRNFWTGSWKPIDVTVPRKLRSRRGIRVHVRQLPRESVMLFLGIPVTTPERTALDLAVTVRAERRFRRLVHEAQAQELVTPESLMAEIGRSPNHPGAERLFAEIADGPTPTRSGSEDDVLQLLRRLDVPKLKTDAHVPGLPGWVTADFLFEQQKVVIEFDGGRWHSTKFRREFDANKRELIEDFGYRVLVFHDEDVERSNEPRTTEQIYRALT